MTVDPALCLHPRLRQMYGPVHECLECGLRGELASMSYSEARKRASRRGAANRRDNATPRGRLRCSVCGHPLSDHSLNQTCTDPQPEGTPAHA